MALQEYMEYWESILRVSLGYPDNILRVSRMLIAQFHWTCSLFMQQQDLKSNEECHQDSTYILYIYIIKVKKDRK